MIPPTRGSTSHDPRAVREAIEAGSRELGLNLTPEALDQFDRYLAEILRWRTRVNLVAASDPLEIVTRHFVDSLLPLAVWEPPEGARLVDVGAGAGFPGMPLKIVRPDLAVVLVEAGRRRVAFLEHLSGVLGLDDVRIVWARAESLARTSGFRDGFDVASERATAPLASSAELCLPLVRVGGVAVLLKGPAAIGALRQADVLLTQLGARIERIDERDLPGSGARRVTLILRKERSTPDTFPRVAGLGRIPPVG